MNLWRLHELFGSAKEIAPCRLRPIGRVCAPDLREHLPEVGPERCCAGDVKLVGSSLQQLHAFASLPIIFVQCEDCPQARFAVKNLGPFRPDARVVSGRRLGWAGGQARALPRLEAAVEVGGLA